MRRLNLDQYEIVDLALAKEGKLRIEWAARSMPVLQLIKERFRKDKPFRNIKIGACLHVTSEFNDHPCCRRCGSCSLRL